MIDKGLVINAEWVAKILSGEKIWEIRSQTSAREGRIAIAEKGGPLVATCTIGKSIAIRADEFATHFDKHRVKPADLRDFYGERPVFAWPLSDVRPITPPIKYQHPGGGSWVTLSASNVPEFQRLQQS